MLCCSSDRAWIQSKFEVCAYVNGDSEVWTVVVFSACSISRLMMATQRNDYHFSLGTISYLFRENNMKVEQSIVSTDFTPSGLRGTKNPQISTHACSASSYPYKRMKLGFTA